MTIVFSWNPPQFWWKNLLRGTLKLRSWKRKRSDWLSRKTSSHERSRMEDDYAQELHIHDKGIAGGPRLSNRKMHMYLTRSNRTTIEKSAISSQSIERYIVMHSRANSIIEIMQYWLISSAYCPILPMYDCSNRCSTRIIHTTLSKI